LRLNAKDTFWAAPRQWASLITSEIFSGGKAYTERPVKMFDGVAVIDVSGVVLREEDDACEYFGGCSTVRISRQLSEAVKNPEVKSILLFVNSPGGQVNGTAELADQIYAARQVKPVYSYISGDGYSGGYWIPSQAEKVYMHEAAGAGAIGVCYPLGGESSDWIISNVSPNKHPEVNSDAAKAQMQTFVDELGKIFVRSVARGRGVEESEVLAKFGQGDIFIAAKAVENGLADGVMSFEAVLQLLQSYKPAGDANQTTEVDMANTTTAAPSAEMVDTMEITKDWLMQNMPDLYEQIRTEGADVESERQVELEAMVPADEEEKAAIVAARKDRKMTAAKLALNMRIAAQNKEQARIQAAAAARAADSEAVVIPVTAAAPTVDDHSAKVIAAMKARKGVK